MAYEIGILKGELFGAVFPMVGATAPQTYQTGKSVSVYAAYADRPTLTTFNTFAPVGTITEQGGQGIYKQLFSVAEMNHDLIILKYTASGCADQSFVIYTRDLVDEARLFADVFWRRSLSNVESAAQSYNGKGPDTADILSGYGLLCSLQNKRTFNSGSGRFETFKVDKTTVLGEHTPTTDANAEPVTGMTEF